VAAFEPHSAYLGRRLPPTAGPSRRELAAPAAAGGLLVAAVAGRGNLLTTDSQGNSYAVAIAPTRRAGQNLAILARGQRHRRHQ
jgi:hypothetical protein